MEVVASLSQGRITAAQCGLFTHKSVPVIFEPPCTTNTHKVQQIQIRYKIHNKINKYKMYIDFLVKYLLILCDFSETLIVSTDFLKYSNIKYHENQSSESRGAACGQTDGQG